MQGGRLIQPDTVCCSRGGKHNNYHPRVRGYLVQGESNYNDNQPRDPTPLAPSRLGPYAIAHRGSSGGLRCDVHPVVGKSTS